MVIIIAMMVAASRSADAACELVEKTRANPAVPTAPAALALAQEIAAVIGVSGPFEVLAVDFGKASPIALATRCKGERYILYDAHHHFHFGPGETNWVSVGIFAHEVGHHINGDLGSGSRKPWSKELQADYFAGTAVRKLGGTLDQALAYTGHVGEEGGKTHPPRARTASRQSRPAGLAGRPRHESFQGLAVLGTRQHRDYQVLQQHGHEFASPFFGASAPSRSLHTGCDSHEQVFAWLPYNTIMIYM
jgi:hypothetical protein